MKGCKNGSNVIIFTVLVKSLHKLNVGKRRLDDTSIQRVAVIEIGGYESMNDLL